MAQKQLEVLQKKQLDDADKKLFTILVHKGLARERVLEFLFRKKSDQEVVQVWYDFMVQNPSAMELDKVASLLMHFYLFLFSLDFLKLEEQKIFMNSWLILALKYLKQLTIEQIGFIVFQFQKRELHNGLEGADKGFIRQCFMQVAGISKMPINQLIAFLNYSLERRIRSPRLAQMVHKNCQNWGFFQGEIENSISILYFFAQYGFTFEQIEPVWNSLNKITHPPVTSKYVKKLHLIEGFYGQRFTAPKLREVLSSSERNGVIAPILDEYSEIAKVFSEMEFSVIGSQCVNGVCCDLIVEKNQKKAAYMISGVPFPFLDLEQKLVERSGMVFATILLNRFLESKNKRRFLACTLDLKDVSFFS